MKLTRTLACALLTLVAADLFSSNSEAAAKGKSKANQVNTPDMWVVNPAPGSLPVGVTHHTYRSESMKREVGYCIYLPPAYAKEPTRRFPVIYHLHGAGGNETRATYSAQVLDEGIRAGKWPDIIIVFPNGGAPRSTRTPAMVASWPKPLSSRNSSRTSTPPIARSPRGTGVASRASPWAGAAPPSSR